MYSDSSYKKVLKEPIKGSLRLKDIPTILSDRDNEGLLES